MKNSLWMTAGLLLANAPIADAAWHAADIDVSGTYCGRDNSISFDGTNMTIVYTCGGLVKVARGAPPAAGWSMTKSTLGSFATPGAHTRMPVKALKNGAVMFIANGSTLTYATPTAVNAGNCGSNREWTCQTVGQAIEFDAELQSNGLPIVVAMKDVDTGVKYQKQTNGSWTETINEYPTMTVTGRCVGVAGTKVDTALTFTYNGQATFNVSSNAFGVELNAPTPCTFDSSAGNSLIRGTHRFSWNSTQNVWVETEYWGGSDDGVRKGFATRGQYYMISRGSPTGLVLHYNTWGRGGVLGTTLVPALVVVGEAVASGASSVAADAARSTFYVSFYDQTNTNLRLAFYIAE